MMASRAFRRLASAPAPIRLLCFPNAGAGASIFRTWPRWLDGVEIYAAILPGRDERRGELPADDIDELAGNLADDAGALMDRPTVLFGHSMGALLAYEVARRLQATGPVIPASLWLSAYRAPGLPLRHRPFHQLADAEFVDALRSIGGTPEIILENPDVAAYYLPTLQADFGLHERHVHEPGEPLKCGIATFAGEDDPLVPPCDMRDWGRVTAGLCTHEVLPGGHFFLTQDTAAFMTRLQAHVRDLGDRVSA